MDDFEISAQLGKGRLGESVRFPELHIEYPGWVTRQVDWTRPYLGDRDRMRVALLVARQNVERKTGGPFGAAIFELETGRLISIGLNQVDTLGCSFLHAELFAIAMAEQRLDSTRLDAVHLPPLELHASCEPCIMCAGALVSSGITRLVCGASSADAEAAGFPPIPGGDTSSLLAAHEVQERRSVLRDEAREILRLYRSMRGRSD
jgi:tRNA(Arg) A34 adenosine deaminase TadA